ncbi:hypothetical protein FA13DRAFT_1730512 [Coprinellus micaceus]|uniref:Uncharacterized protein n=1 Tax=Coprinellus micaceus TaxID=71717 RepID=A0A4Y7TH31_COPMI|nr:hypothetical protein FA13DRAFT_1730512 [Coprinellus micaceus]
MASEKRRKGDKRFQCCYKDCKKMFTTNQNRQSKLALSLTLPSHSDLALSPSVEAYRGEAIPLQMRIRICKSLRPPAPSEQEKDRQSPV